MARHMFLGDMASWVMATGTTATSSSGLSGDIALVIPAQTVTFWNAVSGGTQYTDLLDVNAAPIMSVTSAADGSLPQISGPDGVSIMWADASGGMGPRRLTVATDLGPEVDSLAASAVMLDTTATDIQALGTRAAGSTGKAADAGHVHPATGVQTAVIDTASADIAALGTQAAGSTGKLADAGHVHPATVNGPFTAYGGITVTGDVDIQSAGNGLRVKEGTNAKQGTATLAAGTVTVANTSVTANSRIFLTVQSLGTVTTPSALAVTARTPGTSFTIKASQGTDTSVIAYEIIEPG